MRRPYHLLLVEDYAGDAAIVYEAFGQAGFDTQLHTVSDAESALRFLRRQPPYESAVRPDLILLDLHLHGTDGYAVLRELKSSPEFLGIPILILTSSDAECDVQRAYQLGANGYLVKPAAIGDFMKKIRGLHSFWRNIALLPPRELANRQSV